MDKTSAPAPLVNEFRAVCPTCGSSENDKRNCTRTIPCQQVVGGTLYTAVTLTYTRCKQCGQVYIIRTYK